MSRRSLASVAPDAVATTTRPVDSIPASIVLALLGVATTVGFCRVFDGWEFLGPMLTVVLSTHLVALVMRLVRVPGYVAIPVQVMILFSVAAWKYYPATMSGPLPTSGTWDVLASDLSLARAQFGEAVAPVAAVGGFVVSAALASGVAAMLGDAFAFRAYGRAEAVVPFAVLFVFASALGIDNHRVGVTVFWLVAALATIAILRASHAPTEQLWVGRRGRVIAGAIPLTAVLAGCAALGGAVIGPNLPGAGSTGLVDTRSRNESVQVLSPLVDIRSRLVNLANVEMFSVASDAPHYWRATGLPIFNGQTWRVHNSDLDAVSGAFADPGSAPVEVQNIRIAGLEGPLLPAAFSAVSVGPDDADWVAGTSTLVVPAGLHRGDEFDIHSAVAQVTPDGLRLATSLAPPDASALALPDDFPTSVTRQAIALTSGLPTVYDQMVSMQTWFHTEFTYDLHVQRGHGNDAIENFLRIRRGYCEQFAGTFAAMARAIGVPARVAVGYTPGELRDDGRFHVYGRNAHAWPEIWFDDVGWVSFDPTPGRGEPGAEDYTGNAAQQATADGDTRGGTPVTTTPATTASTVADEIPSATTVAGAGATPTTRPAAAAAATSGRAGSGISTRTLVVLALLAVVVVWLITMPRALARLSARRRSQEPVDVIARSWSRASRTLGLIGLAPAIGETPFEHARRVEVAAGAGNRTLRDLAAAATAAVYGERGDATTARRCLGLSEQVVRTVRRRLNPLRRLQTRLDPRLARMMVP